jgi:hypothetical protein
LIQSCDPGEITVSSPYYASIMLDWLKEGNHFAFSHKKGQKEMEAFLILREMA